MQRTYEKCIFDSETLKMNIVFQMKWSDVMGQDVWRPWYLNALRMTLNTSGSPWRTFVHSPSRGQCLSESPPSSRQRSMLSCSNWSMSNHHVNSHLIAGGREGDEGVKRWMNWDGGAALVHMRRLWFTSPRFGAEEQQDKEAQEEREAVVQNK